MTARSVFIVGAAQRPDVTGMNADHRKHTVDEEARNREAALDRTIEESFPASDPPSSIPNPDDDHDSLDRVDERYGQQDPANRR